MPERRRPPRKTFSRERCLRDCKRMRDAHDRAHCCADCLALQLATRPVRARSASARPHSAATPRSSAHSRRMQLLFGAPAGKTQAAAKKRGGLAGVATLGDAAADRRAGLATSSGIAAAALITCQNAYPGDARREDRERCIAAVTALRSAADNIINAATDSSAPAGSSSSADVEAALEEMRTSLEEIQAQARAEEQAKAEQRRRDEQRAREQRQQDNQSQMWMIGGVALLAVAAGYLALRDDNEAA